MANIKKIKVGDTTYDIRDTTAVHIEGNETINGIKTFNAPANVSGTEQATIKLKTFYNCIKYKGRMYDRA